MFNIEINAISRINKSIRNFSVSAGDTIELLMNQSGYAQLKGDQGIRFCPDEYDIYIPEEEYDKLLTGYGV